MYDRADPRAERALARAPLDAEDLALCQRLAGVYTDVDPPPRDIADRVAFSLSLQALVAEAERLTGREVTSGSAASRRQIIFRVCGVTLVLRLSTPRAGRVDIAGAIQPAGTATVRLYAGGHCQVTEADERGEFAFHDVACGLVRLTAQSGGPHAAVAISTPAVQV